MEGANIMGRIDELVAKRKKGELDTRGFYLALLDILGELVEVLKREEIADEDVLSQIPLLMTFLYDQADKLEKRH